MLIFLVKMVIVFVWMVVLCVVVLMFWVRFDVIMKFLVFRFWVNCVFSLWLEREVLCVLMMVIIFGWVNRFFL